MISQPFINHQHNLVFTRGDVVGDLYNESAVCCDCGSGSDSLHSDGFQRGHFKPFNKVDVFYYSPEHLQPSPWYSLPIQVIYDPEALVKRVIEASKHLTFTPTIYEVEQVISKGLACTHEVYCQVMRGELFYAQALLNNIRYWMIQADNYLSKKPPHSSAFAHFKQRGSQEIIEAFHDSYPLLERKAIISALVRLLNVYRRQIVKLHEKFPLARDIETDLHSLDMVVEWCRKFV